MSLFNMKTTKKIYFTRDTWNARVAIQGLLYKRTTLAEIARARSGHSIFPLFVIKTTVNSYLNTVLGFGNYRKCISGSVQILLKDSKTL